MRVLGLLRLVQYLTLKDVFDTKMVDFDDMGGTPELGVWRPKWLPEIEAGTGTVSPISRSLAKRTELGKSVACWRC